MIRLALIALALAACEPTVTEPSPDASLPTCVAAGCAQPLCRVETGPCTCRQPDSTWRACEPTP